jgi:hypothetical protein
MLAVVAGAILNVVTLIFNLCAAFVDPTLQVDLLVADVIS